MQVFIIVYTGRDKDSNVWDDYPCLDHGYFDDKKRAEQVADRLNTYEWGPNYRALIGDDVGRFTVREIDKHKNPEKRR